MAALTGIWGCSKLFQGKRKKISAPYLPALAQPQYFTV
jgi:hypothetical protein